MVIRRNRLAKWTPPAPLIARRGDPSLYCWVYLGPYHPRRDIERRTGGGQRSVSVLRITQVTIDCTQYANRRDQLDTDQGGYWLVAGDGGVFNFGDAQFYGSMSNLSLNAAVIG